MEMKEGLKFEGSALIFTAGVASGTLLSGYLFPFLAAAMLAALLPYLLRRRRAFAVPAAFFLAGVLCGCGAGLREGPSIPESVLRLGESLRGTIDRIPFPHAETGALLKALLGGDRSGLSRETVGIFRQSGASHLLALSGMHIGILYLLVAKAGSLFGRSPAVRRIRPVCTVLLAGLFTLMTGASPSLVRAFLFILLREGALLTGRRPQPVRVLCGALTLQLAVTPKVLTSIGFQLSYSAMAGIFLLYPPLARWYPSSGSVRKDRFDPMRRIWNAAALSISCQAFTGPVAWHYFHSFPEYFLLTNLLAIPCTTVLMASAVGTVLLAAAGACPAFAVTVTDRTAGLLLYILRVISAM